MSQQNKSEYYELPIKYSQTVLRLLVQSPKRMYAYWDISDETTDMISKNFDDYNKTKPVLRIINLTKNYFYEIFIDPFANNYYIDVEDEDCQYKVELGRVYHNKFVDIYMSNSVTIPRSVPVTSTVNDSEFLFRNYICLENVKKIQIPSGYLKQDYGDLPFGIETQNISSMENIVKKNEN